MPPPFQSRLEPELGRDRLERFGDEANVLVWVAVVLLEGGPDVLADHATGEGLVLELLADPLRGHVREALAVDQGTGGDEAGQLVDGKDRLLERGVTGHAGERGVGQDA